MKSAHTRQWNRAAVARLIGFASLFLPAMSQAQTPPVYTITTAVGTGTQGRSADGAAATDALLYGPTSVVIDSKGNLYYSDQSNNVIRALIGGKVSTVVGTAVAGYGGDGAAALSATVNSPDSLAVDSKGNYYFSDVFNSVVRMVSPSGVITTVAGSSQGDSGDGGLAINARLTKPSGIAVDASGNLYIADSGNFKIRKVAGGNITTIAGSGTQGYCCEGPATQQHLNGTREIALAPNGDLYIADSSSNQIRKLSGGVLSVVAGSKTAVPGFSGDGGLATNALLNHPTGVAVDVANNVYICDTNNNRIRIVTPDGVIQTIAGAAKVGYTGDGGPAIGAQFNFPNSLTVDSAGNIYVADTANNVIRKLTPGAGPGGAGAAPAIRTSGGVQSASDFGALTSIAPGSWIEIYGTNLAATTRSWNTGDFSGINAPTSLNRTTVTIGGQAAFVDYISATQVNAQVPGTIGLGPLPVTVSSAAGTSAAFTINATLQQPALYAPAAYKGVIGGKQVQFVGALFTDFSTYAFPPNAFSGITSRQAKPGDTIVIYGIGFGPVPGNPPGQIAQAANGLTLPLTPKFFFGGAQAQVQYAGLVAGTVGLYQFNVIVPPVADNDAVPLTFSVNINGTDISGAQTLYTSVKK